MSTLPLLLLLTACRNGVDTGTNIDARTDASDADADTDADTDADADTDTDTDSDADTTDATDTPSDTAEPEYDVCDGASSDPVAWYMSADDSNSQAGATLARALIEAGTSLRSAQRVYEFLNYYDFTFADAPTDRVSVTAQARPGVEAETWEVLVAVVGPRLDADTRAPLSLTFSLDTSGSMAGEGLESAQAVLSAIASSLREGDVVSILKWSDTTNVPLDSHVIDGPGDATFLSAVGALTATGSTNLSAGLGAAYSMAGANYRDGWTNRVVLISDGGANTGVTDEELIGARAEDDDADGIYLIGVGTGAENYYSDRLMDVVTDLGKGAYVYVDGDAEAERSFTGDRFLANVEVAARNVQLTTTIPGGWVIEEFHGEEISTNPDEVRPQHLAPNDAMLYSFVLRNCGAPATGAEGFDFSVSYEDPDSGSPQSASASVTLVEMLAPEHTEVVKANAVVAYAEALAGVWDQPEDARVVYLDAVRAEVQAAAAERPDDADLVEIDRLLTAYRAGF